MTDCLFCKIITKEIPATILYEDDQVIAFDDIHPKAPSHKLIIPRKHIATLNDLTTEDISLAGHMLHVTQQLAKKLQIAEPGYRVAINCNAGGGQIIYHLHFHLLGGRPMSGSFD
ncbi:MAG TPA: histidine triad nucleotide-binding protein [Gammaproteobacteria bacterium]|nr:histidine triad nucleotide-binding protein [Gammaproteobacteria bacterium]